MPCGEARVLADLEFSLGFIESVASLGGYGVLLAGWCANSKYA